MRFDAVNKTTKINLNLRNRLRWPNLASRASMERNREIKNGGRKVMKYLELMKWVTWKTLQ